MVTRHEMTKSAWSFVFFEHGRQYQRSVMLVFNNAKVAHIATKQIEADQDEPAELLC